MTVFVISLIRTNTPALVGALVGLLVSLGLQVPDDAVAGLTAFLGFLFTALYYLIVRLLEEKFPQVGILLGYAKSPDSYSKGPGVEVTSKPEGELHISVKTDDQSPVVTGELTQLNSSVVSNLDRAPDHRAE